MKSEQITKILSIVVGAILILMAVAQFGNMVGFSQALASYNILPQYARLWAVVFMVAEFLAGIGLIIGSGSPYVFSSSAGLALVVLAGWFLFGLVALSNNVVVPNIGIFGVFVPVGLSVFTQVGVLILALIALFLAIQGKFFKHRGTLY